MFKALMKFPPDYPNMPPELRFTSEFWHPNVHEDGKVCISCAASHAHELAGKQQSRQIAEPMTEPRLAVACEHMR